MKRFPSKPSKDELRAAVLYVAGGPEQSETVTIPSPALTQTSVDPNRAGDINAIGGLSTSILHDLRNPASAICAAAEILVHMELLPTGVKGLAKNIHRAAVVFRSC